MEDITNEICKDDSSIFDDIEININELGLCRLNEEDGHVTQEIDTQQHEDGHELTTQDCQEIAMSPQFEDEREMKKKKVFFIGIPNMTEIYAR
ncbi:hypothetical protein IHE45_12G063300 [Dioscorea alata]|uniref:Uncharacterized protein n=1 Tax=Dioscorea alata TaxID=55571 RepID=A0ACB7V2D7_DIOAL|nr:hypothetical protein IHE45_12G063300 [Dioscorea alata]